MPEKKKPDRNSIEIFIYPKFVREDKFGSFIPYSFNEILSTLLHDEYQNICCSVDKEKGIMRFNVRNAKTNHLYFSMRVKQDETSVKELNPSAEENNDSELEYVEVVDEAYFDSIEATFDNVPEIAVPLIDSAKKSLGKIEQMLYNAPAFLNAVKATVPKHAFQAVLTDEQNEKLASGALKLMTTKNGELMANLVNPKTGKIVSKFSLKEVGLTPELSQALTSYSTQMQMAQISEQIQQVQLAIEEVRQGQENDRLALAYSCREQLLQASTIQNPELRRFVLLNIASKAEDSRNKLMLSQKIDVEFIKKQPDTFWGKIISGESPEKIGKRMEKIREGLCAINLASLSEAMAYHELGEEAAARKSLKYFANYIDKTFYLEDRAFVERLDLIDPSPVNYWQKAIPNIVESITALPIGNELLKLEDYHETENMQKVQESTS